ncbi:MAG: DNA adenine methylase [Paraclostridium sp.]
MKYMGSKSRIKKEIVPIIQEYIDKNNIEIYIEPFVGGCNVIDSIKCKHRFGNDNSEPLIEMWKHLQNGGSIPSEVPKDLYDDVRSNKDTGKYESSYVGMIGFLASYNGRYFDGGYAKTIISKTGVERNYFQEAKRNVESQIPFIQDVKFSNKDYKEMKTVKNALIYCDIPYKDTKQYHTSKGFNHDEFWEWVRINSEENIILVSELQAPKDFVCIWSKEITRTQNNADRFESTEKIYLYEKNSKV